MSSPLVRSLAVSLVISAMLSCKSPTANTELSAIVGIDEDGRRVALALLPVSRPLNVDPNVGKARFGIEKMDLLARQPAFALVECVGGKHWSGKALDEEQWIDGLEDLALQNRLFLNTNGKIKVYQQKKWRDVPCVAKGQRLVTYPIIEMMQERLMALPRALPTSDIDFGTYENHVLMAQYLYLALRGSYNPAEPEDARSAALLSMMMAVGEIHYQMRLSGSDVVKANWRRFDGAFIPCYKGDDRSGLPAWAKQVAKTSFSCRSIKSKAGWYNFLPGGKHSYVKVRAKITEAIATEHVGLNGLTVTDDDSVTARSAQLWDLLTRTASWGRADFATDMVQFMAQGDVSLNARSGKGLSLQEADPAPTSGAVTSVPEPSFQPDQYSGSTTPGFDVKEYPQELQVTRNVQGMFGSMQSYNPGPAPNYIERSEPAPSTLPVTRDQPTLDGMPSRYAESPLQFNWERRDQGTGAAAYYYPPNTQQGQDKLAEAQQRTAQGFATGSSMYFPLPDANKDAELYRQTVDANFTRSLDMFSAVQSNSSLTGDQIVDLGGYYKSRTGQDLHVSKTDSSQFLARRQLQDMFSQDVWANSQAAFPETANLPPDQLIARRNELAAQAQRNANTPSIGAFTGDSSAFNPYRDDYQQAKGRGVNNPNYEAKYIPMPGAETLTAKALGTKFAGSFFGSSLVGSGLPPGLNNVPGALKQHLEYPGSNFQYMADKQTARRYQEWQNSPEARRIDEEAARARAERASRYQQDWDAYRNQNPYNPTRTPPTGR